MNRLFQNRSFQLKLVDDRKAPADTAVASTPVDISDTVAVIAAGAVTVIAAYMAADTIRQVVVWTATQKIR